MTTNSPTLRAATTRHPDLAHLTGALAWFYATLDHSDQPLGTAANDNDRPASVPDLNPAPMKAEDMLKGLGAPTRVYTTAVRRGRKQVSPLRRMSAWSRPASSTQWGAVSIADCRTWRMQFVRTPDGLEPRSYRVWAGAVTSIWGKSVEQDAGRPRRSEAAGVVGERHRSMEWFCRVLRAVPPSRPRKLMHRRKVLPPIDWTLWKSQVGGQVPLDKARAACGLPTMYIYPQLPGLPYEPEPAVLFIGLTAGRGSRSDGAGSMCTVKRIDPEQYAGDGALVDRLALEAFSNELPEHYATLIAAVGAGSMSDLVATNDNKSGKRRFVRAADALLNFLAA